MARNRKRSIEQRLISSQRMETSVTVATGAIGQTKELWETAQKARDHADYLQAWHDGDVPERDRPHLPDKAPADLRKIIQTATTPHARMLVSQISQQMRVDDIRLAETGESAPAWEIWQRNGMDAKQVALQRAALRHGQSYALVLPAVGRLDGKRTALIRPLSARRGLAFYRDTFDEWPEVFLDVDTIETRDGEPEHLIRLIDSTHIHTMRADYRDKDSIAHISSEAHGMEICPVQRFGMYDLDGRAEGEIWPVLNILRRIDQDTTDRLVIQRFASWLVRTATGISNNNEQLEQAVLDYLAAGDILVHENKDAKFGTLPGQDMRGHLQARQDDIRDLAGTAQVPAYRLLGLSDNIGAEAIAAADKGLDLKADEYKLVLGEQYEATMRLCGYAAGDTKVATDFTSRVHWAPLKTGSLQSVSQGLMYLSKAGVPVQHMLGYLPDLAREDIEEISRAIEDAKAAAAFEAALLAGGGEGGNNSGAEPGTETPAGAE